MPSKLGDALRRFARRNRQRSAYLVGDVRVENPLAAGSLDVVPVLKGDKSDPGYHSQPMSYKVIASHKGSTCICYVPGNHEGVNQVWDSHAQAPTRIRETGYHLSKVRLIEVFSDDPLTDARPAVVVQLVFSYRGPLTCTLLPFCLEFPLWP